MTVVGRPDNGQGGAALHSPLVRLVMDEEQGVTLAAKVRSAERGWLARLFDRIGEWVWW